MTEPAITQTLTLAAGSSVLLVSIIKPILLLPQFVVYTRITSSSIEKDTRYLNLGVNKVNLTMLIGGVLAYACGLLIPIFWIGWPVSILLLAGFLFGYMKWRNAKVPEAMKFELIGTRLEDARKARQSKRATKSVDLRFVDSDGHEHAVPLIEDPLHEVHKELEGIMAPALEVNASSVNLIPGKQGTAVVRVVDTVPIKQEAVTNESAASVIDYLKSLAKLDLEDRRRIQEGAMRMITPAGYMEVDLTVSGSSSGQRARIEIDRAKRIGLGFKNLGLLDNQQAILTKLDESEHRHGVVLVASPEGQGLSTTGYALLGHHDAFTTVVKTCERRVDLSLQGVDQKQWDASVDEADFTTTIRSLLRRDPDVFLTDDITDDGTAELLARSGADGPLIYAEIRAKTVADAVVKWVRAAGDLERAANALSAIVVSRVLRRICPACRQPYQPDEAQLKRLGMGEVKDVQFYRATGKINVKNKIVPCDTCAGAGYVGTIGVFEVMPIDNTARKLIAKNDFKGAYRHIRREERLPFLQEAALAKVRAGETSIDEVVRVLIPKKNATEERRQPAESAS